MNIKPSLNWLLIFVPVALTVRFWPGGGNQTALFICAAIGIIPLAGWMGRATEALAARMGEGSRWIAERDVRQCSGIDHCRDCAVERA